MAKIFEKHSELREDYEFHRARSKRFFLLSLIGLLGATLGVLLVLGSGGLATILLALIKAAAISVLVGSFSFVGIIIIVVSMLYSVTMIMLGAYHVNQATIYGKGLEGEDITADIIAKLPDGYYGFQNVTVVYDGKKSELDMVVAGPTGVFIVETKNRNGDIRGNFDDRTWTQYKVGRGGTPYSNDFYSPVKQVGTHIYRLSHFLRERGVKVHIDGAVYFSNPEADVRIGGRMGNIPVFACADNGGAELIRYIISGNGQLDNDTIGKVCRLLVK